MAITRLHRFQSLTCLTFKVFKYSELIAAVAVAKPGVPAARFAGEVVRPFELGPWSARGLRGAQQREEGLAGRVDRNALIKPSAPTARRAVRGSEVLQKGRGSAKSICDERHGCVQCCLPSRRLRVCPLDEPRVRSGVVLQSILNYNN